MLRPDDQNVYLAPANYSKEISQYNLGILSGEFAPCKNVYCPACDLFGHVGETGQGSKIRFSDLYVEEKKMLWITMHVTKSHWRHWENQNLETQISI